MIETRVVGGDDLDLLELSHSGLVPVLSVERGSDGRTRASWTRPEPLPVAPRGAEAVAIVRKLLPALEFLGASGFGIDALPWESVGTLDGRAVLAPLGLALHRRPEDSPWGEILRSLMGEGTPEVAATSLPAWSAAIAAPGAPLTLGCRPLRPRTAELLGRARSSFRLEGQAGSGRTGMLRVIARRLLVSGFSVVSVDGGEAARPLRLGDLLAAFGDVEAADLAAACRRRLQADATARGLAMLVDGAQRLDPSAAATLALLAMSERTVVVGVAASGSADLPGELSVLEPMPLPALTAEEAAQGFWLQGSTAGSRRRARLLFERAVAAATGSAATLHDLLGRALAGRWPEISSAQASGDETGLIPSDVVQAVDLALGTAAGAERAELLARQGSHLLELGRAREAVEALAEADGLAPLPPAALLLLARAQVEVLDFAGALRTLLRLPADGPVPERLASLVLQAEIQWKRGEGAAAQDTVAVASALHPEGDLLALLLSIQASLAAEADAGEDAERLFGAAAAVPGLSPVARGRVLQRRARAEKLRRRTEEALALHREAEAWFRRGGDRAAAAACMVDAANRVFRKDGGREALAIYERVLAEAEDLGDPEVADLARFNRAVLLAEQGQWELGLQAFRQAAQASATSGHAAYHALDRGWIGILLGWMGRHAEAIDLLQEGARALRAAGEAHDAAEVERALAEIHWRRGRVADGLAVLDGMSDDGDVRTLSLRFLCDPAVPVDAARLRDLAAGSEEPSAWALSAIARAESLTRLGDTGGAEAALRDAWVRFRGWPHLRYEADVLARLVRQRPDDETLGAELERVAVRLELEGAAPEAERLRAERLGGLVASHGFVSRLARHLTRDENASDVLAEMLEDAAGVLDAELGIVVLRTDGGPLRVARMGRSDGSELAELAERVLAGEAGAVSVAALAWPLCARGELLGALALGRSRRSAGFGPADRDRGEAVAGLVAAFVGLHHRTLAKEEGREATELLPGIVGRSQLLCELCARARSVASKDVPVLLRGESGTGKEVFARAIHDLSRRRGKPFLAVNAGATPKELAAAELLGTRRGAFSGAVADRAGHAEQAHGGTLFLDEIGDVSSEGQVALLRLLQEGEVTRLGESAPRKVDVRFVFATHKDLEAGVRDGWFRQDLYYRVNVVSLLLPPLRERPEDVPDLVRHLVERLARKLGTPAARVTPSAMTLLASHPWPGNVRQLENLLVRTLVDLRGDEVTVASLPAEVKDRATVAEPTTLKRAVASFERDYLTGVLRRCDGNRTHAAKLLGLSRQGLILKLKGLGIADDTAALRAPRKRP